MKIRVVLDTNVLLSGWQSCRGASHQVLRQLLDARFEIAVSVPLILEYEEILKERLDSSIFTSEDIDGIIDDLCKVGVTAKIFYLWRPFLPDPEDDHILELAVAAHCSHIITYNKRDFRGVEEKFGIEVIDAAEFLMFLKNNGRNGINDMNSMNSMNSRTNGFSKDNVSIKGSTMGNMEWKWNRNGTEVVGETAGESDNAKETTKDMTEKRNERNERNEGGQQ